MDEFPTLEVAAAFGALVALVRTWLLARSLIRIPEVNAELLPLVKKNQPGAALALCGEAEAAAYLQVVRRVLHAMREVAADAAPDVARAHLSRAYDAGYSAEARRIQNGSARDLVALAVLLGACVYAGSGHLGVSRWFYGFTLAGAVLFAWNIWARRKMLGETRDASGPLLDAATEAVLATLHAPAPSTKRDSRAPFERSGFLTVPDAARSLSITVPEETQRSPVHASDDRCPVCGAPIAKGGPGARLVTTDGSEHALAEVAICPKCGHVAGQLESS